ncbi:hypothetical protein GCM10028868_02750 [Virgibacillus kimchii]
MQYITTFFNVCIVEIKKSLCQAFLGTLIIPIFLALCFCTLIQLPRDCHRLVACHFVLGSTNQEPNTK